MARYKRILSLILCFVLLVPMFTVSVSAATTTINSFGANTTLSYSQYNALRTGTISVVKKNSTWYYRFKKDSTIVFVKPSAFTSSVGNDYTSVNKELTKGVMTSSGIANQTNYVYKKRAAIQSNTKTKGKAYTTYISYLTLTSNRVGTEVDLECKKNGHVQFVYNDKVIVKSRQQTIRRAPSTASEYKQALTRTTSNSISTTMTPVFDIAVTVPGSNRVCLNSVVYRGKGVVKTAENVTNLIDVALTTAKVTSKLATGKLPYKDLYTMYKQVVKLRKTSSEYTSNAKIYLSKTKNGKTYSCMKSELTSPIKLKKSSDYFRAEIKLNKALSVKGTKSKMTVAFSMK